MRYRLSAFALFALITACVVLACGSIGISGDTPTPPSGIKGTVILGPTCPVVGGTESFNPVPEACLTPYAAQLLTERTGLAMIPGAMIAVVALCVLPVLLSLPETSPGKIAVTSNADA